MWIPSVLAGLSSNLLTPVLARSDLELTQGFCPSFHFSDTSCDASDVSANGTVYQCTSGWDNKFARKTHYGLSSTFGNVESSTIQNVLPDDGYQIEEIILTALCEPLCLAQSIRFSNKLVTL